MQVIYQVFIVESNQISFIERLGGVVGADASPFTPFTNQPVK